MNRLQTALTLAAGLVGLTAYVYLLGGAVAWLRIYAAKLPADNATVAFQDRALLAIGIKVLLFELALLAAMTGVVWLVASFARWIESDGLNERELVSYVLRALAASVIVALTLIALLENAFSIEIDAAKGEAVAIVALACIVIAGLNLAGRLRWLRNVGSRARESEGLPFGRALLSLAIVWVAIRYMAVPLGITVIVLVALLELSRHVSLVPDGTGMRELIRPGLILALALNLIIVPYLATPPVTFDTATVFTTDDEEWVGAYVGRTDEGIFLATCEQRTPSTKKSMGARIQVIPTEQVKRVMVGGFKYSLDVGNRPSLYALIHHMIVGDNLDRGDDGFHLDVRKAPDVCGIKGTD